MGGYIGNAVTDRASDTQSGYTYIDLNKPATISGTLYKIDYWGSNKTGTGTYKVKIFRDDGTNYLYIGGWTLTGVSGSLQTVNLSPVLAVSAGDYIAWWTADSGGGDALTMEKDDTGSATRKNADVTASSLKSGWSAISRTMSLYGYITGGGGWSGVSDIKIF